MSPESWRIINELNESWTVETDFVVTEEGHMHFDEVRGVDATHEFL